MEGMMTMRKGSVVGISKKKKLDTWEAPPIPILSEWMMQYHRYCGKLNLYDKKGKSKIPTPTRIAQPPWFCIKMIIINQENGPGKSTPDIFYQGQNREWQQQNRELSYGKEFQ